MKSYLSSVNKQFRYYKMLGEKAMEQLHDKELCWQNNEESNNIAILVNHLAVNMMSRSTDFLTIDGEKSWRNRDEELLNKENSASQNMDQWNKGWNVQF